MKSFTRILKEKGIIMGEYETTLFHCKEHSKKSKGPRFCYCVFLTESANETFKNLVKAFDQFIEQLLENRNRRKF